MTDLISGRRQLAEFKGVIACGGFSYGDVLGAVKAGPSRFCSTVVRAMSSRRSLHVPIPLH